MPPETPKIADRANPASAPSAGVVIDAASVGASVPMAAITADGGGTKNFGTASTRTATSHATTIATSVTSGGTKMLRTRAFSGSMFLEGFIKNGRLARKCYVGSDLPGARLGQSHRVIEDHASGTLRQDDRALA